MTEEIFQKQILEVKGEAFQLMLTIAETPYCSGKALFKTKNVLMVLIEWQKITSVWSSLLRVSLKPSFSIFPCLFLFWLVVASLNWIYKTMNLRRIKCLLKNLIQMYSTVSINIF